MKVIPTTLPGCFEIRAAAITDERGAFIKLFNEDEFSGHGLATRFAEEYVTKSSRGVLRGMHLQLPPYHYAKLVRCLAGRVIDALLDLRVGSPTYGMHELFHLEASLCRAIYLPPGVAHGFYVPGEESVVHYHVTSVHAPANDAGVRWDSAGIAWPSGQPILSRRDAALPPLAEFRSPFRFSCHSAP